MKKLLSLIAALMLVITAQAQNESTLTLGTPAPDFAAADTLGTQYSLSDFADRLVVVDFWASWCGDCRREMPALKQLYADYKDKGVTFISVSFDTDAEAWKRTLRKQQFGWLQISNLLPWHSKVDGVSKTTNPIAADYDLKWIPTLYLVDHGTLVATDVTVETFEPKLREHLDKQSAE